MENWRSARTEWVLKALENQDLAGLVHDIVAVRENWRVTGRTAKNLFQGFIQSTFTVLVTDWANREGSRT